MRPMTRPHGFAPARNPASMLVLGLKQVGNFSRGRRGIPDMKRHEFIRIAGQERPEQVKSDPFSCPAVIAVAKSRPPCRAREQRHQACVRQLRRAGGNTELTSRLPDQVSRLADRGSWLSVPGPAHRLGHPGHLLFEFAVGRAASGVGGGFCGVRDLGLLAVASTGYVRGRDCVVSRRSRVVDIDRSLARP